MADVQCENGYVRIANDIFMALMRNPNIQYDVRILFWVFRNTYGFNKKECQLDLKKIASDTDIRYEHVSRTLRKLAGKNMVKIAGFGTTRKLSFQKDYELWEGYAEMPHSVIKKQGHDSAENCQILQNLPIAASGKNCQMLQKKLPDVAKKIAGSGNTSFKDIYKDTRERENIETTPLAAKKSDGKKRAKARTTRTRKKPALPMPSNFSVTKDMEHYATQKMMKPSKIKSVFENFRDYHLSRGSKFADWTAAWRTWVRREKEYHPENFERPVVYVDDILKQAAKKDA